mmetsp:Transcript_1483/g.3142  ORF Transcript_1483/g.3142 Transcript_1483/m.3142 type:complete len:276 (+) Transcript_1483:430-1257(+)
MPYHPAVCDAKTYDAAMASVQPNHGGRIKGSTAKASGEATSSTTASSADLCPICHGSMDRPSDNAAAELRCRPATDVASGSASASVSGSRVGDLCMLPCKHLFHVHCATSWFERSETCPTCRQPTPANGGFVQGVHGSVIELPPIESGPLLLLDVGGRQLEPHQNAGSGADVHTDGNAQSSTNASDTASADATTTIPAGDKTWELRSVTATVLNFGWVSHCARVMEYDNGFHVPLELWPLPSPNPLELTLNVAEAEEEEEAGAEDGGYNCGFGED